MKKIVLLVAAVACFAVPAFAAPNCAATGDVYDILRGRYGEEKVAIGLDGRGNMIEWWGNEDTGSWTIVATAP